MNGYKYQFSERRLLDYFAVPGLIRLLESEYSERGALRDRAVEALGNIGAAAVPKLVGALAHEDNMVNLGAAIALKQIGAPAIDSLKRALLSGSPQIRRYAAEALAFREGANAALTMLLELARDEDLMVTVNAITALGTTNNAATVWLATPTI